VDEQICNSYKPLLSDEKMANLLRVADFSATAETKTWQRTVHILAE
jgi:hypothetical protein